ncbi:MAG: hypothetical protein AB7O97_14685 [Planctomycetota bacterium]
MAARTLVGLFGLTAAAAQKGLDARIERALAQARPALATVLEGAHELVPGQLALVCLAAVHDGMPHDEAPLQPALERLREARMERTYDLALRLMVTEATSFATRSKLAAADCKRLLKNREGGAFGYSPGTGGWDLSNTQYAALGLRAAAACGVEVTRHVWLRLADDVFEAQADVGGFGYVPGSNPTPSMTVAGIGVLAICEQALQQQQRELPGLAPRLLRAWAWMDEQAAAIGRPETVWSYYFHYGLERAAILCDREDVGGVDWYREGARMLVTAQGRDGSWQSEQRVFGLPVGIEGSPVDTAFAVLFLRRRFQKVLGPVTAARTVVLDALGAQAPAADVDACTAGLVRRGRSALPDVLRALRSDVAPRREAAVRALRAIAGEDFGIDPARSADDNRSALRRAELWYLKTR